MKVTTALKAVALALLADSVSASWGISGATSGVNKTTGARPFRLALSELQASGPMWDLYVQVMQYWQSIDQSNMFSWYQVSGIHGLPQVSWDGADAPGYNVGYCEHGSILFPTWHRPYMALHEQVISIYAHQIADTYPASNKAQYQAAADQLRMPYWDWTTSAQMPAILNQPQVTINAAWGSYTLDNPLYRYNFHPYDANAMDGIYSSVNWTVRAPDQNTQSQPNTANQNLQSNQQQFHDGMYQLFSSQNNYAFFSNTAAKTSNSQGYQSLENLHNIVHNAIGGTMSYLWTSAQDPIFFLHHANVDRLFAMWQAIYPNSYVISQANQGGTYWVKPGATENSNTPLAPFHSDNSGTFYTSNTARYPKSFGYAYKDVIDWNVTAAQLTQNVKANVNKIYNPNGGKVAKRANTGLLGQKAATAADYQYVLNIVADKSKISNTMLVHFLLKNQTFGSFAVNLGKKGMVSTPGTMQAGQIALTHALLSSGATLADTNGTLAMVAKQMTWQGVFADGSIVKPSDLTSGAMKIQVSMRPVTQTAPDTEFPIYGDWKDLISTELGNFAEQVIGGLAKSIESAVSSATQGVL